MNNSARFSKSLPGMTALQQGRHLDPSRLAAAAKDKLPLPPLARAVPDMRRRIRQKPVSYRELPAERRLEASQRSFSLPAHGRHQAFRLRQGSHAVLSEHSGSPASQKAWCPPLVAARRYAQESRAIALSFGRGFPPLRDPTYSRMALPLSARSEHSTPASSFLSGLGWRQDRHSAGSRAARRH